MTTDLFFSQPIPQNPSAGIQSGKMGASGLDQSSKIQATHESPEGDGDNFLTTLNQVFQVRTSTKRPQHAAEARSSITTASIVGDEIDEISDHATPQVVMTAQNKRDAEPDQIASDWNCMAFIKMLESQGFHDAIGESDDKNPADANPDDGNHLAAVKTLIARLQQNQFLPTADLKAGLKHLPQFIADALEEKILVPIHGNSGHRLSPNQVTDLAQFNRWLKGFTSSLQDQKGKSGLITGEGAASARPSVTTPAEAGVGVERSGGSLDMNSSISGTGTFQSTENSAVSSQSENRGEMIPTKLVSDPSSLVSKIHHDAKATNAADPANADSSKIKEALGFLRDPKTTNHIEVPNRMAPAPNQDQHRSTGNIRIRQPLEPMTSSGMNPAVTNVSERQIQSATGEEPLSKVFQDTQLVKKGSVQVQSGNGENAGSKVIKTEAGNNDNGLLNSSGQNTDKSAETIASSKETVTGPSSLRTPTVDQIVRRAVIQLRNGQHEARIDLKPEFLGHIRMQVISENQQVTVKILAEYGFVKDMIENNSHQLKADLQQHGLEFDKLEVSVSRDSDDSGRPRENLAESKAKPGASDRNNDPRPGEEKSKDQRRPALSTHSAVTVDFFA